MISLNNIAYKVFCKLTETLSCSRIEAAVKALDTAWKQEKKKKMAAAAEDGDKSDAELSLLYIEMLKLLVLKICLWT